MYTLRSFLTSVLGMPSGDIPSEEMYCSESNTKLTFLTNLMQETLAGYGYTLVRQGKLELIYSNHRLTLQRGDLLIYSPGFQITIVGGSEDYHSVCLIVDERLHFSDQSSFARFFTRMRGISPKAYRNKR